MIDSDQFQLHLPSPLPLLSYEFYETGIRMIEKFIGQCW